MALGREDIRSPRGRASEYAIDLGGHDEVVIMQSLDLLGLQRDLHRPNRS